MSCIDITYPHHRHHCLTLNTVFLSPCIVCTFWLYFCSRIIYSNINFHKISRNKPDKNGTVLIEVGIDLRYPVSHPLCFIPRRPGRVQQNLGDTGNPLRKHCVTLYVLFQMDDIFTFHCISSRIFWNISRVPYYLPFANGEYWDSESLNYYL